MKLRKIICIAMWLVILIHVAGCKTMPTQPDDTMVAHQPTPAPEVNQPQTGSYLPLYWENTTEPHPERKPWSDHLNALNDRDLEIFSTAKDLTEICPKFNSLDRIHKVKSLGEFHMGVIVNESAFNPAASTKENSLGIDCITKKQMYSEGLYQMSYCDITWKPKECNFDWNKDKNLSWSDPSRDTLDPYKSMTCANAIMKDLLKKYGVLKVPAGSGKPGYWAVLGPNNKYNAIANIQTRMQKQAPFCF